MKCHNKEVALYDGRILQMLKKNICNCKHGISFIDSGSQYFCGDSKQPGEKAGGAVESGPEISGRTGL